VDEERRIRFTIPPFLLFASLLWGAHLGGCDIKSFFKPETATAVLGLLAATAVAIVPIGFVISTLSVALLKAVAAIDGRETYEAVLSDSTFDHIWGQLKCTQKKDKKLTLYVAATFDHELLENGIHKWLMRRWNSFNLAAHSIVALLLAHVFALVFPFRQVCGWWLTTVFAVLVLFFTAINARRETMGMIDFQAHRPQKGRTKGDTVEG